MIPPPAHGQRHGVRRAGARGPGGGVWGRPPRALVGRSLRDRARSAGCARSGRGNRNALRAIYRAPPAHNGPIMRTRPRPPSLGLTPLHNAALCKPGPRATARDQCARAGRARPPPRGLPSEQRRSRSSHRCTRSRSSQRPATAGSHGGGRSEAPRAARPTTLATTRAATHLVTRASARCEVKKCTSRPEAQNYDGKPGGVSG